MKFNKIRDVKSPSRGTSNSAGLDFYIPYGTPTFTLAPGESVNIPSGIKAIIPSGWCGIFFNKSGVAVKGSLVGAQVVDSDYRGEIHLNVHNTSNTYITYQPGQKLVQMILMQVSLEEPKEISEMEYSSQSDTERGAGGFGSTGKF